MKPSFFLAVLLTSFGLLSGGAGVEAQTPGGAGARTYVTSGDCGGFAATQVRMVPDMCLGLVWQGAGAEGPRMPRGLLALAGGDWLVTDLGGWDAGKGAVWRLSFDAKGQVVWRRLAQGLSMPHTVARGPDGRIYVSEMNRILTLDPEAKDPAATVQTVIGDLPDNRLHDNRHPLSSFVFDGNGDLLVNVGAPVTAVWMRRASLNGMGVGPVWKRRRRRRCVVTPIWAMGAGLRTARFLPVV